MKVKMLQYFQGTGVTALDAHGKEVAVLEPGKEYEVDDTLGAWLVKVRKAENVITPENFMKPIVLENVTEVQAEPLEDPKPQPKRKRGNKHAKDTN